MAHVAHPTERALSEPFVAAPTRAIRLRSVAAAFVGSCFSYYDYFLYTTASAIIIGPLFFPSGNPALSALASLATYAVGFVSRPLGGAVFGHVGDRYGRRIVMVWTLSLMGCGTFAIGLLPTYSQAGVMAPVLLIMLRLLQGFATGGESGSAILMATENAPPSRRGLYGGWSQAGIGLGFVLASGVFAAFRWNLGPAFLDWGWRLPFMASVLVFAVGLYIRSRVPETAEFKTTAAARPERHPIGQVLRHHRRAVLIGATLQLAEIGGIALMTTFVLAYAVIQHISVSLVLAAVMVSMVVDTVLMVLAGRLSDSIGRKPLYLAGIAGMALCGFAIFPALDSGRPALIFAAMILANGISHAAMVGVEPALLVELYPVRLRASALAMAQACSAVITGFLPIIAMLLFQLSGSALPVSLLILALCLISATAVSRAKPFASA